MTASIWEPGTPLPPVTTQLQLQYGRNKLINGDMRIDQRLGGVVTNPSGTSYTLDRWQLALSVGSKLNIQQVDVPSPLTGFNKCIKISIASVYSPSAASDVFILGQYIEGFNIVDLAWGTTEAKSVIFSFYVYSSIIGTFSFAIRNRVVSRSYVGTYSITTPNTWERKVYIIPGETSGVWDINIQNGIQVQFDLGTGSNYETVTPNTWVSSNAVRVTGSDRFVAGSGELYFTGLQFESGTEVTEFEHRFYQDELLRCQRYYQVNSMIYGYAPSTTTVWLPIKLRIEMRPVVPVTTILAVSPHIEAPPFGSSVNAINPIITGTHESATSPGRDYDIVLSGYSGLSVNGPICFWPAQLGISAEIV